MRTKNFGYHFRRRPMVVRSASCRFGAVIDPTEAAKRFFGTEYQYGPFFSALSNTSKKDGEAFWLIQSGF